MTTTPQLAHTDLKMDLSNRVIHIVGTSVLQNELLSSLLEKETKATCRVTAALEAATEKKDSSVSPHLYLVDCKGKKADGLLLEFETDKELLKEHYVSLFNVPLGGGIEEDAVLSGSGIFYI